MGVRLEEGESPCSRHHLGGGLGGNFSTGDDDWFLAGVGGEDFKGARPLLSQGTRGGPERGGVGGQREGLEARQQGGGGGGGGGCCCGWRWRLVTDSDDWSLM